MEITKIIKSILNLKRKKAIQFKSKEDLDFVETEYSFRRKISKLQKVNIIFYTLRLMAILLIVIQLGFGGFDDEDPNDPYHDETLLRLTKKPERCLEYIELGENWK